MGTHSFPLVSAKTILTPRISTPSVIIGVIMTEAVSPDHFYTKPSLPLQIVTLSVYVTTSCSRSDFTSQQINQYAYYYNLCAKTTTR